MVRTMISLYYGFVLYLSHTQGWAGAGKLKCTRSLAVEQVRSSLS